MFCLITSHPVPYSSPDTPRAQDVDRLVASPGSLLTPIFLVIRSFHRSRHAALRPTSSELDPDLRVRFPQICVSLLSGLFRRIAKRITLHTIFHAARTRFTFDCAHQKDTKSYRPRRSRHSKTGQDNSTPAYRRRKDN